MLTNSCVGPFPRNRMSFFLLSIFVDELISIAKIITSLTVPPSRCEKNLLPSYPIAYPEYVYLPISVFVVNLTAPNSAFSDVR